MPVSITDGSIKGEAPGITRLATAVTELATGRISFELFIQLSFSQEHSVCMMKD